MDEELDREKVIRMFRVLPIAAKRINIDPAIMAAPMITTIADAASLIIYFAIAKAILGL